MELKEKVKGLPACPGVYLMKDAAGSVIYVGKSKNLKSRVSSYFVNSRSHPPKVVKLVKHLKAFDYILTDTEFEAFLLECRLIKEMQPLYNRLMKSQRSYCYIKLAMSEKYPDITIAEESCESDGNTYFGPYTSRNTAARGLEGIKKYFGILCTNASQRTSSCLNYSLGLCSGHCSPDFPRERYLFILDKIEKLMNGSDKTIIWEIKAAMEKASERLDFEEAARYRDFLRAINYVAGKTKVIDYTEKNRNIIALEPIGEDSFKFFLIKGIKVLYSESFSIEDHSFEKLKYRLLCSAVDYFRPAAETTTIKIGRDEIDESQIIYSYLKSSYSSCRHIIIPAKWLKAPDKPRLEKLIDKLVKPFLPET